MDPKNDANHLTLLLDIALHAADVSNPTKPFKTYVPREDIVGWCTWLCGQWQWQWQWQWLWRRLW